MFLSAFLKIGSEIEVRIVMGRWFHSPGAAKENDLYAADFYAQLSANDRSFFDLSEGVVLACDIVHFRWSLETKTKGPTYNLSEQKLEKYCLTETSYHPKLHKVSFM